MVSIIKKLLWSNNGSTSVVLGLAAVPMVMAAGVAFDMLRVNEAKVSLQSAADTAALAGASLDATGQSSRIDEAQTYFVKNKPTNLNIEIPSIVVEGSTISLNVKTTVDTTFSNLIGMKDVEFTTRSKAVFPTAAAACMIALDPTAKEALRLNSNATIDSPVCSIQVNSSDANALVANSFGNISTSQICVNGNWSTNSNSTLSPPPQNCPAVSDPLANLPVPPEADNPCDHDNEVYGGLHTLSPGVYCGKTILNSGADVTLLPGTYVFRDGEFVINSGSSAKGRGVTLFFAKDNKSRLNVNSNSHLNIGAPTSGKYAGIAVYQERGSTASYSSINSDSSSEIEGVVYFPSTPLHFNSNGNLLDSSKWTVLIANTFDINSQSILHINADYANSNVPVPALLSGSSVGVRLVE